jgi:UDP-N-acetylmuramoylalanine--D-glutamate ligase
LNWEHKNVMVVGMARSGVAAAQLLCKHGATPYLVDQKKRDELRLSLDELDELPVSWHLGEEPETLLQEVDAVVISPAVPIQAPFIAKAQSMGIPVIAELELGYQLAEGTMVAVSGTNGKTTTVTLLGEIFKNAGKLTYVAGNIGYPISAAAMVSRREDVIVAEVSSFQLEAIDSFHPKVAALLNITEDHLNRHGTMQEYIRLKARLFENQTAQDVAVLNFDDPILQEMAGQLKSRVAWFSRTQAVPLGAFVENGKIMCAWGGETRPVCEVEAVYIPGPHNLENALAATAMAVAMGVPAPVIRHSLRTFQGVEHRIERVRELDGVVYYNDSKGTNVDSTIKAVQTMRVPTVIMLGGYDKHTDFLPLAKEMAASPCMAHAVLLGQTAAQIERALHEAGFDRITNATTLKDAIEKARAHAVPGGNVLFSPACASFDMFSDYEQRGRIFKEMVNALV